MDPRGVHEKFPKEDITASLMSEVLERSEIDIDELWDMVEHIPGVWFSKRSFPAMVTMILWTPMGTKVPQRLCHGSRVAVYIREVFPTRE